MRVLTLALVSLIFASGLKTVFADGLLQSEKDIIAWLDKLGYQDFSQTPLVNVATGNFTKSGVEPEQNTFRLGFLIAEDGADFTVVDLDGTQSTYTVEQKGVAQHEAVYFEKLDLMKVVRERIRSRHIPNNIGTVVGVATTEAFGNALLARTCVTLKQDKEAHDLFQLAGHQTVLGRKGKVLSLIDFLKQEQVHTRMKQAVLAFKNPKITRPEILAMFEDVVKHFPKSIYLRRAEESVDLLKNMIKEDRDHVAKKAPPVAELKGEALITELIFQLRTQNGKEPFAWDIYTDEREAGSPAARLVSIGFDAVPQLIDAIGDQRFTRSVGYSSDFYFNRNVLRVEDFAAMILCQIAGRRFYQHTSMGRRMTWDEAESTKKQVEEWWNEIQTKGEEKVLVEAVKVGDQNSTMQAMVLFKNYPDSAIDAIREGLANYKEASVSRHMISLLINDGSDEAIELVQQQLTEGSELSIRVHAARALTQNGQSELALERMLHEWANLSTPKHWHQFDSDPRSGLAVFLLESGSANAVEGLFKQFAQLPSNTQYAVVNALSRQKLRKEPAYAKAVEAFLVECLQLTEDVDRYGTRIYGTAGFGDQPFSGFRVCDFAGYVLTQHWPESYAYGLDGTERDRDANRYAAINHWRRANEMKPIKAPEPFVVLPVANEITNPLVNIIVQNKSDDASKKALTQLSQLGPGAIEAVESLSRKIDGSHPFAYPIKQLLKDLPNTITEVQIGAGPVSNKKSWLDRIAALEGQTFSSELLVNLLVDFAEDRPCDGVRIKAIRDGDGNGIAVTVNWVQRPDLENETRQIWYTSLNARSGSESLEDMTDLVGLQYAADPNSYQFFSKAVKRALARPNQTMRVSASLIID